MIGCVVLRDGCVDWTPWRSLILQFSPSMSGANSAEAIAHAAARMRWN